MKSKLFFALATFALALSASADDQTRNVQTELKNQGFYYGEVDGQQSAETTSAIRRYQIRNGMEVTGTLTPETLSALGLASAKPKQAAPAPAPAPVTQNMPPATDRTKAPVNIRRNDTTEDSDKAFLRREEAKDRNRSQPPPPDYSAPAPAPAPVPVPHDSSVVPPPAPLEAPSADFPVLFAGTPYASAPVSVQQDTLRRAQSILYNRGFYRDIVDGLPGPATEEALLTYQRSARMTLTGRLDMNTLSQLRLLPGNPGGNPGVQFGIEFRTPHHVFRGVWVDRN